MTPSRKIISTLSMLLLFSVLLSSCSGATEPPAPSPTATVAASPTLQPTWVQFFAETVAYTSKEFFTAGVDEQWALKNATWEDGEIHITGNQTWGSYLVQTYENYPNMGVTTKFKFETGSVFSITMQHGEWGKSDYRDIGILFTEAGPQVAIENGAEGEQKSFQGSLQLEPETWYLVSFFIENRGKFLVTVWQEGEISNNGYFLFELDEGSRNTSWRFAASSNENVLIIDTVEDFQFASLYDPATVVLNGQETSRAAAMEETDTPASTPTAQPTSTPVPVSFAEGAQEGRIEEVKRFGIGSFFESEYSPDGSLIAYGTSLGVYLFDVQKNEIKTFLPNTDVYSVTFSPDGQWLAYGDYDGEVVVWNLETDEKIASLLEHETIVKNVLFSPDQQFLLSSDDDGRLNVFQVSDWSLQKRHELGYVNNLKFLPDGNKVLAGTYQNGILGLDVRGWGILNKYSLVTFNGRNYSLSSLCFDISPDGQYIAVG